MSKLIVLCLTFTIISFCVAEQYTDRYDDINIDEILNNRRLLDSYVKCILEKGRCTPEGKELKLHIKDAMINGCEKCTLRQRKLSRQVVKYLREKEDQYWKDILKKYDPEDEYKEIYESFLAADNK